VSAGARVNQLQKQINELATTLTPLLQKEIQPMIQKLGLIVDAIRAEQQEMQVSLGIIRRVIDDIVSDKETIIPETETGTVDWNAYGIEMAAILSVSRFLRGAREVAETIEAEEKKAEEKE
jgi:hypothetical protein